MLQVKTPTLSESLALRANTILETCRNLVITDQSSYTEADRRVCETASLEKGIVDYWKEPKSAAYSSWKSICAKEAEMLSPIKEGSKLLASNMAIYKREFDRDEQKKREEEQEQAKREAQLQAFELAEQGVPIEAVEAVMQLAEEPVSLAPVAELRGKTSFVIDYDVRVIPGQEHFIPNDILRPTTPQMVKALEAKIKKIAKATGGQKIAGIEITQTQSCRRRSN